MANQHWNQQPRHGHPALESTTASWPTSAGINNRVMADQRWNQQPRHGRPAGCTGPGLPEPPLISFRSLEIFALPSRRSLRTQVLLTLKALISKIAAT
ncbi:hypothetical protein P692DRAFT_20878462 [Suillus brevipes Sb2]|nr:hypothetical protein P692DRAFT_20878462 [Suillus brevipes Sb2]